MPRCKIDDKERGHLKRMRRARGGRTLPRSGGGVHEDKKSKKLERQMIDELDEEMNNWEADEFVKALDEIEYDIDFDSELEDYFNTLAASMLEALAKEDDDKENDNAPTD